MKVLVTGATGFVGACLVRRLVAQGYDVHILVRKHSNLWRLQDVMNHVHRYLVDLRDVEVLDKTVRKVKPDAVFHMATYGGFSFQTDREAIFDADFFGTVNLLQSCEKMGFDYFVNTGSSSEYGLKSMPMKENDVLCPIGDYGVAKAAATLFCQSEAIQKKLPIITARLFSPYGCWDDSKRFIPYCIKSLLRGEPVELAMPTAVRDYVFIEDVLDFYQMILEGKVHAGIYNIGSGQQVSIGEVAECIAVSMGFLASFATLSVTPKRTESPCWVADISLAQATGWNPKTSLEQGIRKTILWMQEQLHLYP